MKKWLAAVLLIGCADATEPQRSEVPVEPGLLHDFLSGGDYRDWRAEPELKPGLNGTMHRVFLRDDVDAAGSPVGAAAVRELWDARGEEQIAWSVVVKLEAGEGPQAWFFYETYDFRVRDAHLVADVAATGCASCHAAAPDVIQSDW